MTVKANHGYGGNPVVSFEERSLVTQFIDEFLVDRVVTIEDTYGAKLVKVEGSGSTDGLGWVTVQCHRFDDESGEVVGEQIDLVWENITRIEVW
jgi:hypothetical protein